jgi:hypothetical protein
VILVVQKALALLKWLLIRMLKMLFSSSMVKTLTVVLSTYLSLNHKKSVLVALVAAAVAVVASAAAVADVVVLAAAEATNPWRRMI